MRKKPVRSLLAALLLAALLLCGGCSVRIVAKPEAPGAPALAPSAVPIPGEAPSAGQAYKRGLVSFDELEYAHPDIGAAGARIERIRGMVTDGTDSETIRAAYDELDELFDEISTQYTLASIYASLDVNDAYYADEVELLTREYDELAVLLTLLEIEIYESPHRDVVFYDWTEEDIAHLRISESLYDDDYVALDTRLTEINNAYWDVMMNTTVSYGGTELTVDELDEERLGETLYYRLLNEYYQKANEAVGALYLEFIEIEKKIAEKAGYDDFVSFSYAYEYQRDYTPADAQALWGYVKEHVPAQMMALLTSFDFAEYNGLTAAMEASGQIRACKSGMEAYVEEVSPEMREAYQYLIDCKLSILTREPTSQNSAYTTYLSSYDAPFLYLYENGGYTDVLSFLHEFGHFYGSYVGGADNAYGTSLDVDEIRSQANELLFLPYFTGYYDEAAYSAIRKYELYNALMSIVDGCLFDEFQQYVYTHDVESVEELNEIYREISRSYGIDDDYYVVDLGYVWIDVLHNFECPLYYISYTVSLLPALELYRLSQTDRPAALEAYERIVHTDPATSFAEVLADNSLPSPFSERSVVDIVNFTVELTGVGEYVTAGGSGG